MTFLPPRIKRDSGRCQHCDKPLARRDGEDARDWKRRTHCNRACAFAARAMYVSIHEMLLNNSVHTATGCWEWQLYTDPKGYGRTVMYDGEVLAHRLSYREFKGPIPDGLHILHSCDNPRCINPDHLRAGTNAENVQDRVKRLRSARMWGHNNPNWLTGRHSKLPAYKVANDQ
jgi:hypothetical protein